MATLFRRNGTYYAKWIEGGTERRMSLKTTIKATAQTRIKGIEQTAFMGSIGITDTAKADATPAFAWEQYEAAVIKEPASIDLERLCWDQFIAFSKVSLLSEIRATHVAAWQKHLASPHECKARKVKKGDAGKTHELRTDRPTTVNTKLRNVRVVVNHMIRLGIFGGTNPFAGIPPVKVPKINLKFRPWDEVVWLVNQASAHSEAMHLVFILGLLAGLRKKEILLQRWEYIDWDAGIFHVVGTKTKSSTNPLPLHPDLRACLEVYRQEEGWIVRPDNEQGEYRYRWDFRRAWATICKRAKVTASPHMLRHSVATHLLDLGYTMAQVAVFLRHGDMRSTSVYANLKGVSLSIEKF